MRLSLTAQILAALLLGAVVGWRWPSAGPSLQILATIFIRLVLLIIAPLIFSTLVVGIAGQGNLRKLGSLALQTFGLFLVITTVALAIAFIDGQSDATRERHCRFFRQGCKRHRRAGGRIILDPPFS